MTLGSEEAVRDLATRRPLALGVLYARGIDASSPRTLGDACRERGLDAAEVRAAIARAEAAVAIPRGSLDELVDHVLVTYHRAFAIDVAAAEHALAMIRPACDAEAWSTLARLVGELRADVEQHMAKEEQVLFPWLRARAHTAAAPVRAMQLEHADTLELLHAVHVAAARCLGGLAGALVAAAAQRLGRVEQVLCEHMHVENNELFPRALEAAARQAGPR